MALTITRPHLAWPTPTQALGLVAVVVMAVLLGFQLAVSLPLTFRLGDFGSFWASGDAASRGLDPYGLHHLTAFDATGQRFPQLNPPATLPLFQLVARFPPLDAFRAWYVLGLLAYGLALYPLARRYPTDRRQILWALSLGGLWQTLILGQVYLFLLPLLVGAWLLLPRRPVLAGVLLGLLVAVKPNFLLLPLLLLGAGSLGAVLAAGLVGVTLYGLAALAYGPAIYLDWLAALGSVPSLNLAGALAAALGWPPLALALPALAVLAALGWARLTRPDPQTALALGLCLTLLALPWTGLGYTLFLLPVLWSRPWTPPTLIAAALLVVPYPVSLWLWTGHLAALSLLVAVTRPRSPAAGADRARASGGCSP